METVRMKFTGRTPLMMHNDRMANPLDPIKKEMSKITSKRKKTDEDHWAMARIEWESGLYFDPEIGPHIPGENIEGMLIEAARLQKKGKEIKRALQVLADKIKLNYEGPRDIESLWTAGESRKFVDTRAVAVQKSKIMRTRPIFDKWSITVEIVFNPDLLDKADVVHLAKKAGELIGLCDYRPRYGQFTVEVL